MSRVIVHIETDHEEDDAACLSVMSALKRAGYDVLDYQVEGNSMRKSAIRSTIQEMVMYADPILITAVEPEVNRLPHG